MKKLIIIIAIAATLTQGCKQNTAKKFKIFKPSSKTVAINTLAVYGGDANVTGKVYKVKVRVKPNKTRKLRVGFFEEEVGGTGSQWRSAGWMAAITGTQLLGLHLADYSFTFDVTGKIDGPSAGGIMTAAVLSSILGDKIKNNVSMTGTINPDGTIGPVGGIPQKLIGAKKAKIKMVLIPSGQRFSLNLKTGETEDVINLGLDKGIKVKEVADIYEAYRLLTGKKLPKPKVSDQTPEISSRNFSRIKGKATEWYDKYRKSLTEYAAQPALYKTAELDNLMVEANGYAKKSDNYLTQGLAAPSYDKAFMAAVLADLSLQGSKLMESYISSNGNISTTKAYIEGTKSSQFSTSALLDRLRSEQPSSLSDVIGIADAYGMFSSAIGLGMNADDNLNQPASSNQEALTNYAYAISFYSLAGQVLTRAGDSLDFGVGYGKKAKINKKRLKELSEALRKAAEANLDYFDNVVLAEMAKKAGVSMDIMKEEFANNDFNYAFAVATLNVTPIVKKKLSKGMQRDLATLGDSLQSFLLSSGLIAEYYSLDAIFDNNGNITGVSNEKALINMLDIADKKAVAYINLAKKLKADSPLPVLHYEIGKVLREGDVNDKLDALTEFWTASTEARLLAMLSGKNFVNLK
jgi:predicted S18 family serine protease